MMDWTAIITSLIAMCSALGVAYLGHSVKKDSAGAKAVSQEQHAQVLLELKQLRSELDDNNLRTLRLDLLHAIETDPNNIIVIMEMAQKYFVDMKGNCYMSKVFQEWASDHNVSVVGMFNKD